MNARLSKPIVDCARVSDRWPARLSQDCGCDAEPTKSDAPAEANQATSEAVRDSAPLTSLEIESDATRPAAQ